MATKHIIWTSDIDQFTDDEIRDELVENGYDIESITDTRIYDRKRYLVNQYYEDEKENLNKRLNGRVICIAADLDLWAAYPAFWHGRRPEYRIMSNNLNEVLNAFCGDFGELFSDGRNVSAIDAHHYGNFLYTFREIREDRNIDNLLAKLYAGTATSRDITTYTRSLAPYVADIYGWTIKRKEAAPAPAPATTTTTTSNIAPKKAA